MVEVSGDFFLRVYIMELILAAKAPATTGVEKMKIEDCAIYPCKERKKPVLCFGVCALLALLPPSFNLSFPTRQAASSSATCELKDLAHVLADRPSGYRSAVCIWYLHRKKVYLGMLAVTAKLWRKLPSIPCSHIIRLFFNINTPCYDGDAASHLPFLGR